MMKAILGCLLVMGCTDGAARIPPHDAMPVASGSSAVPPPAPTIGPSASSSAASPAATPWPRSSPARVATDWCTDAVSTLDEETCYVLPEQPTRTLLVYLHGVVPPTPESHQKTNLHNVVANASKRAGVVALLPRGKQGLAPKRISSWWGWPTNAGNYSKHAAAMVAGIADKRRKLEEVVGVQFSRVYVAGSSSGAYFASALALRGGIEADGFGVMSGGSGAATPELPKLAKKPFYIGFGEGDTVAESAKALGEVLRHAGWPVRVAGHRVGHGAKEVYLDEAFAFWREHERSSPASTEQP
jgi:predicted esterase